MTFKFIVKPKSLQIEFEAGSVGEGAAILEQEGTQIAEVFKACPWIETDQGQEVNPSSTTSGDAGEAPKTRKPRGPNKSKNQPDPTTASAPPPVPVAPAPVAPAAPALAVAPPPPAPAPPVSEGIPPFLQRNAPVAKTLAPKVKVECEKRAAGAADGGQALANWLADCGVVNKTTPPASFAEAMTVVELASDDQLAKVAEALGL